MCQSFKELSIFFPSVSAAIRARARIRNKILNELSKRKGIPKFLTQI